MLGKKVECIVTGLQGIASVKVTYINGCVQFCVLPRVSSGSSEMPDGEYIDVQQLKVVGDGVDVIPSPGVANILGKQAECKVTGFKGIITAELVRLNGSISYCLKPKVKEKHKMPDGVYIDFTEIKIIGNGIIVEKKPTGGPQRDCPRS